ncbi:uncharacterized protein TrAFT101_010086 [Trichoderma asperellum]|uniref:Mandelate racemase/muconate lactonizing enzyme N-terminal domain-containing protein n=1 Tax=Trichoderma asperellum (strain ATCC 204424 / CBS 433.97 / NBRC 101777) TaxID=1042311 RepID=A0A2T3Z924_TRIA4|nr:hypothetical protein M441DRAFT_26530 [Trichoderma asperellum CBS 433.97]PTB41295.1 hypothetical protein M441DRAFT_26530 [Trichoderma asperellum CBS 433.97]UKZ95237.1 hypothetical protein TrAFT101_010086 [Trichoderma asperellum]
MATIPYIEHNLGTTGEYPQRVDRIIEVMEEATAGHPHAKTALDVACWGIFGKSVRLPECELLGNVEYIVRQVVDSGLACKQ